MTQTIFFLQGNLSILQACYKNQSFTHLGFKHTNTYLIRTHTRNSLTSSCINCKYYEPINHQPNMYARPDRPHKINNCQLSLGLRS